MERILTAKINYLAQHTDHHLFLLTYEQSGAPLAFELDKSVQYIPIDNIIPLRKDYSLLKWLIKYLNARKQFRKNIMQEIEQTNPDIIICNVYSFSVIDIIIRIATSLDIKTVIESHTKLSSTFMSYKFHYNKTLYYLTKKWDQTILHRLKSTSCVVALTKQDAIDWKPYVKNIIVIPNFITIEPQLVKDYSVKRVITAGRYSYEKGYDMLLQAWAIVIKDYPDWQLHIFGDEDRSPYIKISELLKIRDSVFLHPSTTDIAKEFSKSSIYVLSSRYEGFGLVLAEAMSCGLPCISFDCPYGPREIINDGEDGLLARYKDIKDLANKISKLMSDSCLRYNLGKQALKNIMRYEPQTIMNRWINLFDTL